MEKSEVIIYDLIEPRNDQTLFEGDKEAVFDAWWTKNILPLCNFHDLQIVNRDMVKLAFFTAFPLFENLYDLSIRLREWNKNHPAHDPKAIEAFQTAGDMIEQLLDLRIKKENLSG